MAETATNTPQWGLVIDIDRCTGCSACVVACAAENNAPVVGPEECARGRHQQWIHVQRFFSGEYPEVTSQHVPMMCQHCGNAPCESVCPVYASSHTMDGLNAQIYNRCIGTRFCANNCPYHVRLFNFFSPFWASPLEHQLNPDVTVRDAGVMEKCTFCVQRIRRGNTDARVRSEDGKGTLADGEVVTACAQACPSRAITFGLSSDPESTVSRLIRANKQRSLHVLAAKHTEPHVTYLKRVEESEADVL